jgi:hypothetical protein
MRLRIHSRHDCAKHSSPQWNDLLCTFCSTAGSPGWTLHTEALRCDPERYQRYRRWHPFTGSDSGMSAVVDVPSDLRVTT